MVPSPEPPVRRGSPSRPGRSPAGRGTTCAARRRISAGRASRAARWRAALAAALLLPLPLAAQQGGAAAGPPPRAAGAGDGSPSSSPLRVLDVPYLPQSEALCGGAAAAMVMRYWGDDRVTPGRFAGLVRPEEGGIRSDELAAEIRRLGWRAARVGGSLRAVRTHLAEGRPVLLLIRVGPGRFHYVTAVAARRGEWLVHDPALAPYRRLSAEELRERWGASGRWGLVVLPPGPDADGDPPSAGRRAAEPGSADDGPCAGTVAEGVRAARSGRTARADSLLRRAVRRCPRSVAPRRELAGLRFRQGRWRASASLAARALADAPGDGHALRTLAAARYMAGDGTGALAAWNRLDEPRLTGLRVYGLRRTRYRPLRRQIGLAPGRELSPGDLRAARRRAAAVPAVAASRVGYRPPAGGRTELEVALLERPLLPSSPAGIAGLAVRAAADRELRLGVASLTGGGELWTAAWSWWEERPRVEAGVETPGLLGVPGVWGVRGSWRRAGFRSAPAGADAPAGEPVVREEVRRAELSLARWTGGSLRLEAAAVLEDWTLRGRRAGLRVGARLRGPSDRLALSAGAGGRAGPGAEFWRADLEARGRWPGPGASRVRARAGVAAAGRGSPRMLWPGAGTGHVRRPLLRAHPLAEDGIVAGPGFGRVLAHAGAEAGLPVPLSLPLPVRAALFLDAARAWEGPADAGRALADLGAGLRLGLPGGGRLRLDAATGLADGAEAVSVGWEGPWPGW